MKSQHRQDPKGKNTRTPRGKFKKLPPAAYIWGVITLLCVILMAVLYSNTSKGASDSNPLLLIYNRTGKTFYISEPAFANSIHAAGFDYLITDETKNEIPEDITGRHVVIMGVGNDSFTLMRDINENTLGTANKGGNNILGYILVDPKYPGNLSVEKYDYNHPSCEVAMFGFGKSASSTSGMSDVRRLFERMSGVDTVYGPYASRGWLPSSRVYSSADQKRYLSLYDHLTYSMLFNLSEYQSELAGYLATTYGQTIDYGRINTWVILTTADILFGIASLFMFLFFIPVPERRGISFEKVGDDGMAAIVNMGLAIWFGVLIIAGYMIPYTQKYVIYIIEFAPLFMMLVMVMMRSGFILTNKIVYTPSKAGFVRTLAAATGVISVFVYCYLLVTGGTSLGTRRDFVWITAVIDFLIVTALGFIDKKSRAGGENGCSYFGNIFYMIELLIPAGAAVATSFFGLGELNPAVLCLLTVVFPFICSNAVKRISDHVYLAGLTHAVVFALLIM